MTQLSPHERACLDAMRNSPHHDEASTVDIGANVFMAKGWMRSDATKAAQRLFDKYLKSYIGA
jgi:hypothetical protein